jgi:hypothetical protein
MLEMIKKRENRDNVLFIKFENFIIDPNKYIQLITSKLQTKENKNFDKIMNILELPREQENEYLLDDFLEEFRISDDYFLKLKELINLYESIQ